LRNKASDVTKKRGKKEKKKSVNVSKLLFSLFVILYGRFQVQLTEKGNSGMAGDWWLTVDILDGANSRCGGSEISVDNL
jgi:hypothetical protein